MDANCARVALLFLLAVLAWSGDRASALPPALLDSVPAESFAVYLHDPASAQSQRDPGAGSALTLLGALADQAYGLGALANVDACTRQWLDSFTALTDLLKHPFAFVVFEVRARARSDGGHELADLRAALIVQVNDDGQLLRRRIQHLLNVYTNSTETRLECATEGEGERCALRDRRLPSWASIGWRRLGGVYVVGIGEGSLERASRAIETKSGTLGGDAWCRSAIEATSGRTAGAALHLDLRRLRSAVDTVLAGKISRSLKAMSLDGVERAFYAFGADGEEVEVSGYERREGVDHVCTLAGRKIGGGGLRAAVPTSSTRVAAFDVSLGQALTKLREAYLAARSPRARERSNTFWGDVERDSGVQIERDLYAHLGKGLIVHNYPPHALSLPIARTIVVPVTGDAATLRTNLDRFFGYFRDRPTWLSPLSLVRDDGDGVWYLMMGITGPAVAVTDRWLIVSFSPEAVRANLRAIESSRSQTGAAASTK